MYKFRGKRIDGKGWAYGSDLEYNGRRFICAIYYIGAKPQFTYMEVHPESVGMWTGIKDKNGKEMYAGDIFHFLWEGERWTCNFSVEFKDGIFGLGNLGMKSIKQAIEDYSDQLIIIGNTTNNPGLLK